MDQAGDDLTKRKARSVRDKSGIQAKVLFEDDTGASSSDKTLTDNIPNKPCEFTAKGQGSSSDGQSSSCMGDGAGWKQPIESPVVVLRDILSQIKSVKFGPPTRQTRGGGAKSKGVDVQPGKRFLIKEKRGNNGVEIIDEASKTKIAVKSVKQLKNNGEKMSRPWCQDRSIRLQNRKETLERTTHEFSTDNNSSSINKNDSFVSNTRQGQQLNSASVTEPTPAFDQDRNVANSAREPTILNSPDDNGSNSTDGLNQRPHIEGLNNNGIEKSVRPPSQSGRSSRSKPNAVLEILPVV